METRIDQPLILQLAAKLAEWFPDLEGRSIAVVEMDPFKDDTNRPALPMAATALISEAGAQPVSGGQINLEDTVLLQFMYPVQKYRNAQGQQLPFYAFYNYEALRNKLLTHFHSWVPDCYGTMAYRGLEIDVDEFAVYISFRFVTVARWRPDQPEAGCEVVPQPITYIKSSLSLPPSKCRDACEPEEEEDCLHEARLRNPYGKEAQEENDAQEG